MKSHYAALDKIVLQQMLEHVDTISLAAEPKPILHNVLRGFESLPVEISAAK